MGVVPGVMGLAAFAPPLDEAGNSVKAQRALAYIAGRLNLGVFGTTRCVMAETGTRPAGVDLRRQLGKRPAHDVRRPFPLRDAPGGKNREGGGEKKRVRPDEQ